MSNKIYVIFSLVFLLSACASSTPYSLSDTNATLTGTEINVVDNRDQVDIKGGLPLFGNPTYSVPDSRFSPSLIDLLKTNLANTYGESINGQTLTINEFSVDNFFGQTYKRNQAISGVIVVGDESDRDAIIVYLSGDLNGKNFESKVIAPYSAVPPMTYMGMHYDLPESRDATKKAVSEAIANAISDLK